LRVQRASEGIKHGNPTTHTHAVINVIEFFLLHRKKKDWHAIEEYLVRFNDKWNKKEGIRLDYSHSYDIAVLDNEVKPVVLIEVDGEKHRKQKQILNDQRAERYADEVLKTPVIRLDKVECNGLLKDRNQYFRKELVQYIKK
jgi:hypothetical protein